MLSFQYTVTLTLRADNSVQATGVSNIPQHGLPVGGSVQVTVVPGDPGLSNPVLLLLSIFDTNAAMSTSQKGALVSCWALIQGTTGMFLSAGLVPVNVGPTTAANLVTFTNINPSTSEEVLFFGVSGTVQLGADTIKGWNFDPEVLLLGGEG